jgi:hypothetical protein
MTTRQEQLARRVAARLDGGAAGGVTAGVERCLHEGESTSAHTYQPVTIALAGSVVSVATLAWNIYRDLQRVTPRPAPQVSASKIRLELAHSAGDEHPELDRVIAITLEELTATSEAND